MGINKEPHHTQEVIKPECLPAPQQDEEEDDEDGPPPGFDSIHINLSTHKKESNSAQQVVEEEEEDDDDDGPPPGFQLIATKIEKSNEKSYQEEDEEDEDDDGPPPGFEDDDVAIPNSHSIPTVQVEIENGFNRICNSRSVGGGSEKLGFKPISVKGEGDDDVEMPNSHPIPVVGGIEDGLNPNCNSESVSGYGPETLGFRSVLVREEERQGDGFELGFQSREEKREADGSGLRLQSFSVKNEVKITNGSKLAFHSVHGMGGERENDEFELGSQSVPVKEGKKEQSISEIEEYDDNDDEGPPPGWDSFPPSRQPIESPAPPSAFSCGIGFQSTHVKEEENIGDEFQLGSLSVPMKEDGKDGGGFELEFQTTSVEEEERGGNGGGPSFPSSHVKKEEEEEDDVEGPPPGWDSFPPARPPSEAPASPQLPSLTPPPSHPRPSADSSGKAQMVCGSCRKLLSYSRGARFVQCSCCQTVNLVLEVGQVKCRGCAVLLMYPFGAPSVQCSSCLFVTKVGVQNKRPPLSVQQGRSKLPAYPVH